MTAAMERIGFGTSGELAAFFEIVTRDEAKAWCREALAAGRIIEADSRWRTGQGVGASPRRLYSTMHRR
jgi:uncharacterized protein YcaQ